ADYIEIARCYHTVFVSRVPVMDATSDDAARRFVTMVDEFYDRGVKLLLSAAADQPEALYRGERLAFDFRRTASRLHEMKGRKYLARPHRA
ncbi:MAG: AFG1/ZapE family ATPase, partial [Steroidobacteraceae bacterium]